MLVLVGMVLPVDSSGDAPSSAVRLRAELDAGASPCGTLPGDAMIKDPDGGTALGAAAVDSEIAESSRC